jgi:tetratricopeptide (TPR) repeat protein
MQIEPRAEHHLERGRAHFEAARYREALDELAAAFRLEPMRPQIRSYYGLCVGIVERSFERARELCQSAARDEFFNPDLYLNLALLHLSFDRRGEALRYLRRGQMIDPASAPIRDELERLGRRRPPVLRFLPRGHLLNRWLGQARRRLERDEGDAA